MSKERGGSKKLGRGRKRQWMGQISKEGERRMEKRDGEKNGRVGKKSTKI